MRIGTLLLSALLLELVVAGATALPAMARTHAAVGPRDSVSVSAAWGWIRGQLGTGTTVTTASTVEADRAYPPSWTDAVSGRFSLDGVPAPPVVLDPATGTMVYQGLVVRAIVVTDTAYPIAEVPAEADGTFSFLWSRPGTKVFQLVDEADGAVLAEDAPRTGLVRSFGLPEGAPLAGRTFTYDQALALLTALSLGHRQAADTMASGLRRLITTGGEQDGGFVTSAAALNPEAGAPEYRTGVHAIATYALLRYLEADDPADPARPATLEATRRAVQYLLDQQVSGGFTDGLVTGGHGEFRPGVGLDPTVDLPWSSTEHNVDAWHTLTLAATVLDDPACAAAARRLDAALRRVLWDPATDHFLQGWTGSAPDPTEALDVNSWGAIQLSAAHRPAYAADALRHTTVFASVDAGVAGYAPVPLQGASLVWVEGSAGVALAQLRLGRPRAAAGTLDALAGLQRPDGAFPGATRDDPATSMTSAPAVAGTAWAILVKQALAGRPSIWDPQTPGLQGPARQGAAT